MRVYGLTGGIGSGKSTVARLLATHGAAVIDADRVARDVVEPGTDGLARVVAAFGSGVVDSDGKLDRKAVGVRVFSDEDARRTLNGILHPLIAAETARRIQALAATDVDVTVYEAALLVESGGWRAFDGLIVVESTAALQEQRVVGRDSISVEDARRRMLSQTSNSERRAAATFVLVNDGSLAALEDKVARLYPLLVSGSLHPPDSGGSAGSAAP
ncbi:MAG: dephospho-CoA kinase [Polyangia bacterium]